MSQDGDSRGTGSSEREVDPTIVTMTRVMSLTTPWFEYLRAVTPYTARHGKPAPHQPALVLTWLQHRFLTGNPDLSFADAEQVLKTALPELSKSKDVAGKTNQPFSVLMRSDFWESNVSPEELRAYGGGDLGVTVLRDSGAAIRPRADLIDWLDQDPTARAPVIVRAVLEAFFPPRVWRHVLDVIHVPVACSPQPTPLAAAYEMRYEDLRALRLELYGHHEACQACGVSALGLLEIAHPHWLVCGGETGRTNAWLLCRTDATAVDLGLLGLGDSGWISSHGAHAIGPPPAATDAALWHRKHVLRAEA